jgi:ABC-2 type transport system ATP-binding protein
VNSNPVEIAVRAHQLGKRFGRRPAVSGLSFTVTAGEVFGLLGPNGAGKTTTLRMLSGLLPPDEGDAEVAGLNVRTQASAVRARVGLLTEQPGLYNRLTALENVALFGRLNGLHGSELNRRLERTLRSLGLWEVRDQAAGTLSKGTRQRVAIALALVHDPAVILLDEPTSGLDPEAAWNVRELIASLAQEGRTLFLCSHNLTEVERLCRRVGVLRVPPGEVGGELVALTEVAQLRAAQLRVRIELASEAAGFQALLQGAPGVETVAAEASVLRIQLVRPHLKGQGSAAEDDPLPDLVARLVQAGARIRAVVPEEQPLEDAYLSLVAERGAA